MVMCGEACEAHTVIKSGNVANMAGQRSYRTIINYDNRWLLHLLLCDVGCVCVWGGGVVWLCHDRSYLVRIKVRLFASTFCLFSFKYDSSIPS